jgi:hypothetical protein
MDWLASLQQGVAQVVQAVMERLKPSKPEPVGQTPAPVSRKVSMIVFNPTIPSRGGRKLSEVISSNNVDDIVAGYIADLKDTSHGYISYEVVERSEVDRFPTKEDGFTYTPDSYLQTRQTNRYHSPDWADYQRILQDSNIIAKINSGMIDEVWMFGFGGSGFYESRMVGPGAFDCNSPELTATAIPCNRRFIIMGFNWERGVGEMLEAIGHRSEDIIKHVFRNTAGSANLWSIFTRYDKTFPGQAEMGTVHYAPNSEADYEWGNPLKVPCRAHTWTNFPNLTGVPVLMDCNEWGGGDIRLHHRWWLGHFPHITGAANGVDFNWWKYIVDPNTVH